MQISLGTSHIIGIDISSRSIKIVGIRRVPYRLSFYTSLDIREEEGYNFISESIVKVLKQYRALRAPIFLSVSHESIAIRRVKLPAMPQNEILNAFKWQTKDRLPYDTEQAYMDFKILREFNSEDGSRMLELSFVAIVKDVIERYIQLFKKENLDLVSINVSPFCIENVLKVSAAGTFTRSALVVDFGHTKTDFIFFKDATFQFIRTIPIASRDITEVLRGPVSSGSEKIELSQEEAESLKRQAGIPYEAITLDKKITAIQVLTLIRGVLERLLKELQRSIDYYHSEMGGDPVEEIYLVGAGASLKNLDRYLSEELSLPVKRLEIPKAIDVSRSNLKKEDHISAAVALGAALDTTKKINLIPQKYRSEKLELIETMSLRVLSVIVAAIFLVSFLFVRIKVDDYAQRLKNVQAHLSVLSHVRDLTHQFQQLSSLRDAARRSSFPVTSAMKAISRMVPQNMLIRSFSIDPKARKMSMSGILYESGGIAEEILTKFSEGLESSPLFREAQVTSILTGEEEGRAIASFTIESMLE